MYCRVIACDFDGTGATDGHPAPEVYAALSAARAQGITTLLVTGRVLEDVQRACEGELAPFDAIVAENGAIIQLCALGRTVQVGRPPPEHFLGELRARGVPFHAGAVVLGTWEQHAYELLDLVRQFGIDGQLVFNRGALMLLPSGVNKAVGIRRAFDELGRSERNLVAFGDAENDIPMLLEAEIGIAARGAVPAVLSIADDRISQPGGAGVALYVTKLLERGGMISTPARRHITVGKSSTGNHVAVPASGSDVLITGDPRTGKSWIAGLVAEQLVDQGYHICIVDPEGDYVQMGERPKVITLGHDMPLPPPATVSRLLDNESLSVVMTLSALAPREQLSYIDQFLGLLERSRRITGMPHWIIIDEAHYFFTQSSPCLKYLGQPTGTFCLATYRPSLLASEVYDSMGAHIITSTRVEEERYLITKILQAHAQKNHLTTHLPLDQVEPPSAALLTTDPPAWQLFVPERRITRHTHHARKYADTRLPDDKAFRFAKMETPLIAHNMIEFYKAVENAAIASLLHHLLAGDFSRWVAEVLGDQDLARGLRKLERATPAGATPDRLEILAHIEDRYLIRDE